MNMEKMPPGCHWDSLVPTTDVPHSLRPFPLIFITDSVSWDVFSPIYRCRNQGSETHQFWRGRAEIQAHNCLNPCAKSSLPGGRLAVQLAGISWSSERKGRAGTGCMHRPCLGLVSGWVRAWSSPVCLGHSPAGFTSLSLEPPPHQASSPAFL